jgi:hydrogenase maturation protease
VSAVLVIGVGNELLGDEGLGVHVARSLRDRAAAARFRIEVLEAGTALFDLAPEIARHSHVVLVDAIRAGAPPGTVYRMEWRPGLAGTPAAGLPLSLHDWGFLETLRAIELLGMLPARLTIIGAEPARVEPGTELSEPAAMAKQRIVEMIERLAEADWPARDGAC